MLHTIKAGDISKIIEALEETPSSAEHAFRVVRTFFNFCVKRGYLGTSPVAHLEPPRKGPDRERVLSDDELVKVWRKAQEIGSPYGTIVQLLILTGQRTGEIAALKWEWVSTTGIDFPAPLAKNGRAWRIPVGELTARILASVPKQGALLFPARGHPDQPFRGFGVRKLVLDQCGVVGFTHHDLRRTYATNLARLSVPIHVLEKLLNHSSGVLRGVAAIYNRYSYEEEMRSAQALWEKHVASLIDPDYDARVPGTQPGAVATGSLFGSYRDEDVIETPTQRVGPLQPATRCAP